MGTPTTLQLPFTGGLDQKTSRFYLDPNARLATVQDGNFIKVGAIDKRAGLTFAGGTGTGNARKIASWSKSSLVIAAADQLFDVPTALFLSRASIGSLPGPRVIRRPIPTAPPEIAQPYSQNMFLCDYALGSSLMRIGLYVGSPSPGGNQQLYGAAWDANTGDIVTQPTLVYTSAGGGACFPIQIFELPSAGLGKQIVLFLCDGLTIYGLNFNPATRAFSSATSLVSGLLNTGSLDAVPFVGDTTNSGFVLTYQKAVAGNTTLQFAYFNASFAPITSGTIETGGPTAGTGTNFTADAYIVATVGDAVWFVYGAYTTTTPSSWNLTTAVYSGDGLFTVLSGPSSPVSTLGAGRIIPPVRYLGPGTSNIWTGYLVQAGGGASQINSFVGSWVNLGETSGTVSVTSEGNWPTGLHPAARGFIGADGALYQPAELCLYAQSGVGAQVTQSTQGTLFLLQFVTNTSLISRLLPAATVAPRQKTIDAQPITGIGQQRGNIPLMSNTALSATATRLALGIRTIGVDTSAVEGAVNPAWSVDFFFDAADTALLYPMSEIGQELHVGAGSPFVFDGTIPFEDSFFYYPEFCYATQTGTGSALTGTYTYAIVYSFVDSAGLIHRSVPAFTAPITLSAGQNPVVNILPLSVTWKDAAANNSGQGTVFAEIYRTTSSPSVAQFYLLNRVVASNTNGGATYTTYEDITTDANLDVNTLLYTTGGVLDNPCPPCAALQCVHKNRLWIVDETLRVIWFTQAFSAGLAPSWNELMTVQLPDAGDITAIAELDDKLIVFKATSISVIYGGDGLSITGTGSDITNPQRIATDVGALDWRSVVLTPDGLMFRAASGIYLLSRSLEVSFVGVQVVDLLATYPTVVAATLVPSATQVRFECNNGSVSVALVYDYLLKQWALHTRANVSALVVSACLSSVAAGSVYSLLTSDGNLWQESATSYLDTDSSAVTHFVPTTVSTAWIKLQGVQGYQRARRAMLIAEELDDCGLSMGFSVNYSPTIKQTYSWSSAVMDQLPVFQVEQHVAGAYNKGMALQITVSDIQGVNQTTGQGARFIGLAIELDQIGDRMRQVPAAGKA